MLKFRSLGQRFEKQVYREIDGTESHIASLAFVPWAKAGIEISTCVTSYLTLEEMKECVAELEKARKG